MRHKWTALGLLLVGMASAYLWQFGPLDIETRGQVWNISGAVYRIVLLAFLAAVYRSAEVRSVLLLLAAFDAMVAGCSVAYLHSPWPIKPDEEACSARLDIPLGLVGAVIGLALVISIAKGKK